MADGLLPLDDVTRRLPVLSRSWGGMHPVRVDRIIGTLDRSGAFDRDFTPLLPESRGRLDSLRRAFPEGDFPPITVVEYGGRYFVVDGHHRVRLARERAVEFIDADVTRMSTPYRLREDVDLPTLIHTQQRRAFLSTSGLAAARPGADITFSRIQGYPELLEVVQAATYAGSCRAGRLLTPEEGAGAWYDGEFRPGVAALRARGLDRDYGYKTDADLWLWVHQIQRRLVAEGRDPTYPDAAQFAGRARVPWSFRRAFLRQRSRPLAEAGEE